MRSKLPSLFFCLALVLSLLHAQTHVSPLGKPDVVLRGEIHPSQEQTYIEAPFEVPAGTHRLSVAFENLGRDQHTVIDLGIEDPFGLRGESGGNKDFFTISDTDANPSYLPRMRPCRGGPVRVGWIAPRGLRVAGPLSDFSRNDGRVGSSGRRLSIAESR